MVEQIVSLEPGESKVVSFTATPAVAKTYTVTIDGLSGSFVCIGVPPEELPSGFEIDVVNVARNIVAVGDEMTIYVRWWCPGHIGETFTLHCTVDGTILSQTFVADDNFGFVYYKYTPQEVGTYTATVRGVSCTFEAREKISGVFYDPYGGYTAYNSIDAVAGHISLVGEGMEEQWGDSGSTFLGYFFHCPYCSYGLTSSVSSADIRLRIAYSILAHIQASHPQYPLTMPRSHIEVDISRLAVAGCYRVMIDGGLNVMPLWSTLAAFATVPGTHHVEVDGPCDLWVVRQSGQVCGTILFNQNVTLRALGDKVTIAVATGLIGYQEWKVPIG